MEREVNKELRAREEKNKFLDSLYADLAGAKIFKSETPKASEDEKRRTEGETV